MRLAFIDCLCSICIHAATLDSPFLSHHVFHTLKGLAGSAARDRKAIMLNSDVDQVSEETRCVQSRQKQTLLAPLHSAFTFTFPFSCCSTRSTTRTWTPSPTRARKVCLSCRFLLRAISLVRDSARLLFLPATHLLSKLTCISHRFLDLNISCCD